ncbi:MAG: tRNA glutamyl-Q(34) synthetase GluQRS [Acetobacterales bacterium]
MTPDFPPVTRFAPSPTGLLHLGHAHSALVAWHAARDRGGRHLLRIEDIDPTRCRPEFEAAIVEDLDWLGVDRDGPARRQSDHMDDYRAALGRLEAAELVYPCFCTRADIRREIEAAGGAPHGPEGPVYPGTCRALTRAAREARIAAGDAWALRLDMLRAIAAAGGGLEWHDIHAGPQRATPGRFGDVVLARKETPTSYHLSVTVDDALQGVTLVTRGMDLFEATHIHRLLQALLDLPVPEWAHHPLLTDENGRRYAKRDKSLTLRALREQGLSAADVRKRAGFSR